MRMTMDMVQEQERELVGCLVKKLTPTAQTPTYGDPDAIGADIFADEDAVLPSGTRKLISTGLMIEPLEFGYVRVAPRSGLAVRGIDVGAGVVDTSFRGECKVLVINNSGKDFEVKKGMRIAQMIFEEARQMSFEFMETLSETARGAGGFGSTGV